MGIVERLDGYGKGAWIALTLLAFCVWGPLGLAMLVFLAMSGRMRSWRCESRGRWYNMANGGGCSWGRGRARSSGNAAFDDYRAETLRRLEEEQREFEDYLNKLRAAKDKSEFDQFMADRRGRGTQAPSPEA
jgi:hypothetical protein